MPPLQIHHPDYKFSDPADFSTTYSRLKSDAGVDASHLHARFQINEIEEIALFSEVENALIGGLSHATREDGAVVAFQIWIAPPFRERGHATVAGKAFVQAQFENGCHRLETAHRSGDGAPDRLVQNLRFLPEGIQRSALRQKGQWIDLAHYGLLALDPR
tara:strand:- start:15068 stop:15547 length:480 start_codon:yes stop_codon:yes gene_type:complete